MMIKPAALLRGATLSGLLVLASLAVGGSAGASGWARSNLEAASAAIPAQAGDNINDLSVHVNRPGSRTIRASAVATGSAICDGCTANAVTMQVIYARSPRVLRIDNVAAAWSSCSGCRAAALSLQVVIARKAGAVTAGNRALAVNAACVDCHTAAMAVQIVIASPSNRELSKADLDGIEALRKQLELQVAAQLGAPQAKARMLGQSAPRVVPQPALTSAANQIQALVTNALGGTSARRDIQVQTG
jgi:hypothetical protein